MSSCIFVIIIGCPCDDAFIIIYVLIGCVVDLTYFWVSSSDLTLASWARASSTLYSF